MTDFQNSRILDRRVGTISPLLEDRASGAWHKVTFAPPFPSNRRVVVMPMTQTYNGQESPGIRIQNVTPNSFEIRFDETIYRLTNQPPVISDGNHINNEIVGWVAYGF